MQKVNTNCSYTTYVKINDINCT